MKKKTPELIIDSRHLKVLSAKRDLLKDSVVFICLDEDRYGHFDVANLRRLTQSIDKLEPTGCYFTGLKNLRMSIFDKSEIKNRDIVITLGHPEEHGPAEIQEVEEKLVMVFGDARSISIVHNYVDSVKPK